MIGACFFFYGMQRLSIRLTCSGRICDFLKNRFEWSLYSNSVQVLLSAQIALTFASATSMMDRHLDCCYKIVNYTASVFCLFAATGLTLLHPVYLLSTKVSRKIDTKKCYVKAIRMGRLSEKYVASNVGLRCIVAICIPILSGGAALILLSVGCLLQMVFAGKAHFENRLFKAFRIIYMIALQIINISLTAICFFKELLSAKAQVYLGFVCIGCICTNICL